MKPVKIILISITVLLFCTTFNACAAENQDYAQNPSGYEHRIGDAVFYTEHDLEKYIVPKETNPLHKWLDLEAMLHDVWGDIGMLKVSDGYVGTDGSSFTQSVGYDYIDGNNNANCNYDVKDYCFVVSGTRENHQCSTRVTIYGEERPSGNWLVVKDDVFGFSPDMAALLLYVLEQTESNPRSNIAGELSLPSNYECSY